MYSIKMRANENGIHVSGAETICDEQQIPEVLQTFFHKGFHHDNGDADFLNLKIEKVTTPLKTIAALPIIEETSQSLEQICLAHGITKQALNKGMNYIFNETAYTGAVIVNAQTGERIDESGSRGIRVTHFCFEDQSRVPITRSRVQDALTIASCVTAFDHVMGELCVSDDLHYTTGYFASVQQGYHRIHNMKPSGTRYGGRVIFVDESLPLEAYVSFLQQQPKRVLRDEK